MAMALRVATLVLRGALAATCHRGGVGRERRGGTAWEVPAKGRMVCLSSLLLIIIVSSFKAVSI